VMSLRQFLEGALEIVHGGLDVVVGTLVQFRDGIQNVGTNKLAGHVQATVKEYGGDQGFESVHQQGLFSAASAHFFAAAKFEIRAEVQAPGNPVKVHSAHQVRLTARKFAFALIGKTLDQCLGDQKTEDGITQEFQLFIVVPPESVSGAEFI